MKDYKAAILFCSDNVGAGLSYSKSIYTFSFLKEISSVPNSKKIR